MKETLLEALLDSIKALPILLLVYILIEYLEHKKAIKFEQSISNKNKVEPMIGSLLGVIPQCGFSAIMADLFSRRMITIGTLFAVFIATSDEALAILITHPNSIKNVIILLTVKLITAIFWGYLINLIVRNKIKIENKIDHHEHHQHECDDCEHNELHHEHELHHDEKGITGLFKEAFKHTFQIFSIILISNIVLGLLMYYIGEDNIKSFLENNKYISLLLVPLVGLIPSCAPSVILVELYTSSIISFATCISGLISGAGVGLIVLYKRNKNLKQNILITVSLYVIGLIMGLLLNIIGL